MPELPTSRTAAGTWRPSRPGDDPIVVVGGVHLGPQAAAALGDVVVIQVQHGVEDVAGPLGQGAQHQAPGGLALGAGDRHLPRQPAGGSDTVILHVDLLLGICRLGSLSRKIFSESSIAKDLRQVKLGFIIELISPGYKL